MTLEEAIALVKEKDKRSVRCDCLDCQAQTVLVRAVELARKHLQHAVDVCSCPDCWRARHGGVPGKLTGKHAVIHVAEEAEKIWDAHAKELAVAIDKAGLAGKTAVEAITILDAEETKLSAKLREYRRGEKE